MADSVEKDFIRFLNNDKFIFLYEDRKNYSVESLEELKKEDGIYNLFLYKKEYGSVYLTEDKRVDVINSSVIQLTRTRIDSDKRKIFRGRLWSDANGKGVNQDYLKLNKWIKKNVPYLPISVEDSEYKEYISNSLLQLHMEGYELFI